jgi:hypothetical protein
MPLWRLKTKDNFYIEGDDMPFSKVKVEDISEFYFAPANIAVILKEGQRLIFFKRHQRIIGINTGEEIKHTIAYVIGFQKTENGKNVKVITEIGDTIILRDNDAREAIENG